MCLCIFACAHMHTRTHTYIHTCIKNSEIAMLTPNGVMHCRPVCGYAMVFFWDVDKWGSDTPFLRTVRLATILNVWEHIHTWLADSLRATTHEFWDFFDHIPSMPPWSAQPFNWGSITSMKQTGVLPAAHPWGAQTVPPSVPLKGTQ